MKFIWSNIITGYLISIVLTLVLMVFGFSWIPATLLGSLLASVVCDVLGIHMMKVKKDEEKKD